MDRVIGIDLGTSNSCVAVMDGETAIVLPDSDGKKTQASVVSFFPDGTMLVGNEAHDQLVYNPEHTIYSAKRLIGRPYSSQEVALSRELVPYHIVEGPNQSVMIESHGRRYSLVEIGSFILMKMKEIAEEYLGEAVHKAVITVPANFNDGQRMATKKAGELAGLDVLKVINEPTAAALAYGFGQSYDQRLCIYDFGGGTFDVTMLEIRDEIFEVIATDGDSFLGGNDIDNRIVTMIVNSYRKNYKIDLKQDPLAMLRIRSEAEKAKINLSVEETTSIKIPSLIYTDTGAVDLNVSLTRPSFEKTCEEIIQRTFTICDQALKASGLDKDEVENVVLVGGSTYIPVVRKMVENYFGRKPFWGINPEEVVALGAAIQGGILGGSTGGAGDAVLLDVTSQALGIGTISGRIEKIIERNTPIPVERTRIFTTSRDGQEIVRIRVYQGETVEEADAELMGVLELTGLDPKAKRGESQIEVTFEIDTNGIVQVFARDLNTGHETFASIDLKGATDRERRNPLFSMDDDADISLLDGKE